MTTPIDDLNPVPPQPELAEGNQVFHQKSYDLYVWIRTKLAPALEYVVNLLVNFVTSSYNASSTTSMALTLGVKTITVQNGRGYVPGNPIRVASIANPLNYIDGIVNTYNTTTGALNFTGTFLPSGVSGTFSSWSISILPAFFGATLVDNKFTGRQVFADLIGISTPNLTTLDLTGGNYFNITGAGTIIDTINLPAGGFALVRVGVTLQITASTQLQVQGIASGQSLSLVAGDFMVVYSINSTFRSVAIHRLNGRAVVEPTPQIYTGKLALTANTTLTNTDWGDLVTNESASNLTATLPAVTGNANKSITFSCIGTGTLTIARSGTSTINIGSTSVVLRQGQSMTLVCDGTNFIQASANRNFSFTTSQQTITSGSVITIAHGMGQKPRYAKAYLICNTTEHAYAVGDEFESTYVQSGGGSWGVTAAVDATNIYLTVGTNGIFHQNRSTGAAVTLTNANWRIIGKMEL